MTINNALGSRIKGLRQKIGKTQAQFAEDADLTIDGLSMIERGENWPQHGTIEKIAYALGLPATDLFDGLSIESTHRQLNGLARARAAIGRLSEDQLILAAELLETLERNSDEK